jgi:hypothetical protein
MSAPLLLLVTVCYVGIAIAETSKRNYTMATVFAGYALANVGLIVGLMP